MFKLAVLMTLTTPLLAGCSASGASLVHTRALTRRILSLPPWCSSRDLTDAEWLCHISLAREMQRMDPAEVESALHEFSLIHVMGEAPRTDGCCTSSSRSLLLLCVMFDLPDPGPHRSIGGWIDCPVVERDHNLIACPISWDASRRRPAQVARWRGYEGGLGDDGELYRTLLANFRMRDLPRD